MGGGGRSHASSPHQAAYSPHNPSIDILNELILLWFMEFSHPAPAPPPTSGGSGSSLGASAAAGAAGGLAGGMAGGMIGSSIANHHSNNQGTGNYRGNETVSSLAVQNPVCDVGNLALWLVVLWVAVGYWR